MLTGKWTPMNREVASFNSLVDETKAVSEENDEDWMMRVEILYKTHTREPENFGEDALPRPPDPQRIAKSQRSSNSTASSGSNPTMSQEMMQQQYNLDRKEKMDVIQRETNSRVALYDSQKVTEDLKVLQISTDGLDPVDAAIINAQKA
ncbi:hypothetical protein Tco_1313391 [Tanacetum coccineum]